MNSFEELTVYQKARDYRIAIAAIVKNFPVDEKFRLTDQLIRASRSVTAQIAEGHGRYHYQENSQFCRIARGSLEESHEHLLVALDSEFIDEKAYLELLALKTEVLKLLNGYINYLQKQKQGM